MTEIDRAPLDELVAAFAEEHHCPTIAWGVVSDGALKISGAVGDVTEQTVYRIASMTKSFSAAATLLVRDEGVLRLDDPIALHDPSLDGLRSPTSDAPPITIRDLLAMTSGLVADDAWADRHLDLTDEELDRIIASGCVFAEPTGVAFEYSNFAFAVLGRVIQRATGTRIQDVISSRLLAALGMERSTWVQPAHDDWAPPLDWIGGSFVDEMPTPGDGLIAPMGGIWTTVADLARWVAWLDDAFPARDDPDDGPLRRSSRREMQTIQRYVGYRTHGTVRFPSGYGYGLRVHVHPELGTVVTHSGGLPGYGSNMRWLPGRRLGVIALSNATYAPMTDLGADLLDRLHEQGAVPDATQPVTAALRDAAQRLVAALNGGSNDRSNEVFSDNVALDDRYSDRRATLAPLTPLTLTDVTAINDARGHAVCTSGDGTTVTITFALAVALPARVQDYEVSAHT